jgi:hypothetical protein
MIRHGVAFFPHHWCREMRHDTSVANGARRKWMVLWLTLPLESRIGNVLRWFKVTNRAFAGSLVKLHTNDRKPEGIFAANARYWPAIAGCPTARHARITGSTWECSTLATHEQGSGDQ